MDRNRASTTIITICIASLSARRAWIEIARLVSGDAPLSVALRKESVDRNNPPVKPAEIGPKSLSARRAWIEMPALC